MVYGKHIFAFVEIISGWQFADAAPYFRLLPAMLFLFGLAIVDFLRLWFSPNRTKRTIDTVGNVLAQFLNTKITGSVLDYIHAFMHIIITLGWLLILLLAIIENTPVMPLNGETGILPSFQIDPFSTAGAAQSAFNAANPPTLHLSIAINLGYYLLLAGIVIGGLAVFKKIIFRQWYCFSQHRVLWHVPDCMTPFSGWPLACRPVCHAHGPLLTRPGSAH